MASVPMTQMGMFVLVGHSIVGHDVKKQVSIYCSCKCSESFGNDSLSLAIVDKWKKKMSGIESIHPGW